LPPPRHRRAGPVETGVARLPIALDPWEVDLLDDVEVRIDGVDVEGVLMVVEGSTGFVRLVTAIRHGTSPDELRAELVDAMVDPGPQSSPARPRLVGCRDEGVRERVAAAFEGLGIEVRLARELPALEEAATALRASFGVRVPWPGVTGHVEAWRAALRTLAARAPWTEVSDEVSFCFDGGPPGLAQAVALLAGKAGEKRGLLLFPSAVAYGRYLDFDDPPTPADIAALDMRCVHLVAEAEVDLRDRREVREAGFVVGDGLFPRVFAVREARRQAVEPAEQEVLLAAVEAVVAMCDAGAARLEAAWEERDVPTTFGTVRVTAVPG
jgi:hypothetical protein